MLLLLPSESLLTQLQLLLDVQPQKMPFRELKHDAAEPASLPTVDGLTLPADLAVLVAGKAADHLQQAGLATAAGSGDQHGLPVPGRQGHPTQYWIRGCRRAVVQRVQIKHVVQLE